MSKVAILERFFADKAQAGAAKDPMAALLSLATVSTDGGPQVRTLVLRDIENQLAVFLNQTSPKWLALQHNPSLQFMTYWPSSLLQYRFTCTFSEIDKPLVDASWQLRPESPRRLDHVYETQSPQSAVVENRRVLLDQAAKVSVEQLASPAINAVGIYLHPNVIERLDLNQEGAPHDRRRYRADNHWCEEVLVP